MVVSIVVNDDAPSLRSAITLSVQDRGSSPKALLEVLQKARQDLTALTAVATNASEDTREIVRNLAPIVDAAQKLADQIGEMLYTTTLFEEGASPGEVYRSLIDRCATLRQEIGLSESGWSDPPQGARVIRNGLKQLEAMEQVGRQLVSDELPQIVRRAVLASVNVKLPHATDVTGETPQQEHIRSEIFRHVAYLKAAFEIAEPVRFGREEGTERRIVYPPLTGKAGLAPQDFLVEFDRHELTAFKAALGASTPVEAREHASVLVALAKRQESIGAPSAIQALCYLVLESRQPIAMLESLRQVQHPKVLEFAERVLAYPRSFQNYSLNAGYFPAIDKGMRSAALHIMLFGQNPSRIFSLAREMEKGSAGVERTHGFAALKVAFCDSVKFGSLPPFTEVDRAAASALMDRESREIYLSRLLGVIESEKIPRGSEAATMLRTMAREALSLMGDPVEAPVPLARRGIAKKILGPVLVLTSDDERIFRTALRCLARTGGREDAEFIRTLVESKKIGQCRNRDQMDSRTSQHLPLLRHIARETIAALEQV